ncbi:hypothetical protein HZS61_005493 [Fusarium oxysporum f. sp. conglutinans]|uniref:HTH CENPB-type domain-containing protein n=3 Tax=Fusarium oxysporum f. sp. conglutinans TaxID=100902 RepID=A0A8H6G9Y3_FUSOX|nr:hypothetical protein HZS61_005493 [Fusarium oxysporum f. sp. conglutinans]
MLVPSVLSLIAFPAVALGSSFTAKTIGQLPLGTWLENVAVRSNGDLLVTELWPSATVYTVVKPADCKSGLEELVTFPSITGLLGIAEVPKSPGKPETFIAVGSEATALSHLTPGTFEAWAIEFPNRRHQPKVKVRKISDMTKKSAFLNGVAAIPGRSDAVLVSDSVAGTLRGRLTGAQSRQVARQEQLRLTTDQEDDLERWILRQKKLGHAPTHAQVRTIVRSVLARHGDHAPLGRKWTTRFVERHPALKTKLGRRTDWERVNAATPANIKRLFDVYETVDWIPPERRYNADEGGIMEGQGVNGLVIGSSQESPNAVPVKTATSEGGVPYFGWRAYRSDGFYPADAFGINGIKVRDSYLYFTNSNAVKIYRIAITPAGYPKKGAKPQLVADLSSGVGFFDDFEFDTNGNIYAATNFDNSIVFVDVKTGKWRTVVGGIHEMTVAGSTAAAFSYGKKGEKTLYVSTSGALAKPVDGTKTEGAKVVAVKIRS